MGAIYGQEKAVICIWVYEHRTHVFSKHMRYNELASSRCYARLCHPRRWRSGERGVAAGFFPFFINLKGITVRIFSMERVNAVPIRGGFGWHRRQVTMKKITFTVLPIFQFPKILVERSWE
jgi:hypothetical protein